MTCFSPEPKPTPTRANLVFSRLRLAAATVFIGIAVLSTSDTPRHTSLTSSGTPVATPRETRRIYPFSVIPGGVQTAAELREALRRDPIAAKHYAGFDLDQTRVEHVTKPRLVYVSYRVADRVYWTGKRVQLPKGETILTDGVNCTRTRCGNRISDTPQGPTEADEPTEQALNFLAPKPSETTPPVGASPLLGKEQVGRGAASTNDYQAAFGSTTSPTPALVAGGGVVQGAIPPVVGPGFSLLPQAPRTPGSVTVAPIAQDTGVPVPVISFLPATTSTLFPNFPSGFTSFPAITVLTITPANPVQLAVPPQPRVNVVPVISTPSLSVNQPGFETLSLPSFFPSPVEELVPKGTPIGTQVNEIPVNTGVVSKIPVNNEVATPEPSTIFVSLFGTTLLFLCVGSQRLRRPESNTTH